MSRMVFEHSKKIQPLAIVATGLFCFFLAGAGLGSFSHALASTHQSVRGHQYILGFNQPSEIEIELENHQVERYRKQQRLHTAELRKHYQNDIKTPLKYIQKLVDRLVFQAQFQTLNNPYSYHAKIIQRIALKPAHTTGLHPTSMETTLRPFKQSTQDKTLDLDVRIRLSEVPPPDSRNQNNHDRANLFLPTLDFLSTRHTKPENTRSSGLSNQVRNTLQYMQQSSSLRGPF